MERDVGARFLETGDSPQFFRGGQRKRKDRILKSPKNTVFPPTNYGVYPISNSLRKLVWFSQYGEEADLFEIRYPLRCLMDQAPQMGFFINPFQEGGQEDEKSEIF